MMSLRTPRVFGMLELVPTQTPLLMSLPSVSINRPKISL